VDGHSTVVYVMLNRHVQMVTKREGWGAVIRMKILNDIVYAAVDQTIVRCAVYLV